MSYTTEQCKAFLIQYFLEQQPAIQTQEKEWKRTKKYKNEQGAWLRDFIHPVIGALTLLESEQGLSVVSDMSKDVTQVTNSNSNTKQQLDKTKLIDWLVFDKKAQKEASKIINYYVEELDVDKESIAFEKYSYAIPNQIGFYFYHDYLDNSLAEKKLSLKIGRNGNQEICVTIAPLCEPHFDQHMDWLIANFLPDYLDEISEAFYDVTDREITLEQFVRDMSQRGFVYLKEECFFGDVFSDFHFQAVASKNEKNKQLAQEAYFQVKEKIIQADKRWLEEKIQSGFDSNTIFANGECALIHAFKHNQHEIFALLLKHTNLSLLLNGDSIIEHICRDYYHHQDKLDVFFENYLYPFLSAPNMLWQEDTVAFDDELYPSGKTYKNPSRSTIIYLDYFRQYPELVQKTFALFDEKLGLNKTNELISRFMQSESHLIAYPELANRFLDFCSQRCANGDSQFIGNMIQFENYPLALRIIQHTKVSSQNLSIGGQSFNDFFNTQIKGWQDNILSEMKRGLIMYYEYPDGTRKSRLQEIQEHIDLAQRFIKQVQSGDNGYDPTKYRTKF